MAELAPIVNRSAVTMSSREIAELTGKRHDHVLTDIRKMLAEIQSPEKSGDYKDDKGRTYPMLLLNKREALILVSGYSIELRARIIDRWQELEAQQQPTIPQSYAAALLEAGRLAMELEQAQQQLQEAAPAVEFMDRYVEAKSTKAIREVAKVLNIPERRFTDYLEQHRILFRMGKSLVPYAQYQHRGLFEVKTGETHGHAWKQTRFTPEGVAWIASRITRELGGVA